MYSPLILLIFKLLMLNTPKITSALVIVQAVLFTHFSKKIEYSLIPFNIIYKNQGYRLITNHLFHVNEIHIYMNMIALIYRGAIFERLYGSRKYILSIILLATLSSILYTIAAYVCYLNYNIGYNYLFYRPVVGFSAILFGLKTYMDNQIEYQFIFGYRILSKYEVFLELVLISVLEPNVSFLGHLCGIVAGLGLTFLY